MGNQNIIEFPHTLKTCFLKKTFKGSVGRPTADSRLNKGFEGQRLFFFYFFFQKYFAFVYVKHYR